jgi:hypothetical protein
MFVSPLFLNTTKPVTVFFYDYLHSVSLPWPFRPVMEKHSGRRGEKENKSHS